MACAGGNGGRGSRSGKPSYGKVRLAGSIGRSKAEAKFCCFRTAGTVPISRSFFETVRREVSHLLVLRFEKRRQQAVDPQQSGPRQANRIVIDFQIAFALISPPDFVPMFDDVDAKLATEISGVERAGLELQNHLAHEQLVRRGPQAAIQRQFAALHVPT